MKKFLFQSHSR